MVITFSPAPAFAECPTRFPSPFDRGALHPLARRAAMGIVVRSGHPREAKAVAAEICAQLGARAIFLESDPPAGLGAWLLQEVQHRASQRGFRRVIHALMHESNNSLNLSRRFAEPFRRYTLYSRSLA